jgi:hypothetical protein
MIPKGAVRAGLIEDLLADILCTRADYIEHLTNEEGFSLMDLRYAIEDIFDQAARIIYGDSK